MRRVWPRLVRVLLLVLLSGGGFGAYTFQRGQAELAAAQLAWARGEPERALRHAGHAAAAYVPGAAHVDAAHSLLRAVALGAERAADPELAAAAWQAMRGAALGSSHFWQPRAAELALANANLARLGGFSSPAAAGLESQARSGAPRLLLGVGFLGAMAALGWFCAWAWSDSGSWRPARAAWPALGWCVGVLVLGWALLHA